MPNIDIQDITKKRLYEISKKVRCLIESGRYGECKKVICGLMEEFPDNGEPQNFYGILLEAQNDHIGAMKHFRAAWALDPTYLPARNNMEYYNMFFSKGRVAYNEDDCPKEEKGSVRIEYDSKGIGRIERTCCITDIVGL